MNISGRMWTSVQKKQFHGAVAPPLRKVCSGGKKLALRPVLNICVVPMLVDVLGIYPVTLSFYSFHNKLPSCLIGPGDFERGFIYLRSIWGKRKLTFFMKQQTSLSLYYPHATHVPHHCFSYSCMFVVSTCFTLSIAFSCLPLDSYVVDTNEFFPGPSANESQMYLYLPTWINTTIGFESNPTVSAIAAFVEFFSRHFYWAIRAQQTKWSISLPRAVVTRGSHVDP